MSENVAAGVAEIIKTICQLGEAEVVGPEFSIAYELDSVQIIEFIVAVDQKYGVMYGDNYEDISALSNVASFANWVEGNAPKS